MMRLSLLAWLLIPAAYPAYEIFEAVRGFHFEERHVLPMFIVLTAIAYVPGFFLATRREGKIRLRLTDPDKDP